jgi:hypothetical protein
MLDSSARRNAFVLRLVTRNGEHRKGATSRIAEKMLAKIFFEKLLTAQFFVNNRLLFMLNLVRWILNTTTYTEDRYGSNQISNQEDSSEESTGEKSRCEVTGEEGRFYEEGLSR